MLMLAGWTVALCLGTCAAMQTAPSRAADPTAINVISFNIRNAHAPDGDNAWPNRSELFFRTIRAHNPDLLGMQEVVQRQLDETRQALPEYDHVGVAREDGKQQGEYAPLFYRRDRFELIETGTWWLSPTPAVVGSVGWDAALTRIATWARLRDKASDQPLLVINTHFDHVGVTARLESAKLLREKTKAEAGKVLVMGDFNCDDDDAPYLAMIEGGFLVDSYRQIVKQAGPDEATFHAFNGNTNGKRIDFIFTRGFTTEAATIDRTRDGKRCPSDHDAVTARVRMMED